MPKKACQDFAQMHIKYSKELPHLVILDQIELNINGAQTELRYWTVIPWKFS